MFSLTRKISLSARTSRVVVQRAQSHKIEQLTLKNSCSMRQYASTSKISNQQVTAAAAKAEPFLNGSNSAYVEDMYESWLEDPSSVHKVWQQ